MPCVQNFCDLFRSNKTYSNHYFHSDGIVLKTASMTAPLVNTELESSTNRSNLQLPQISPSEKWNEENFSVYNKIKNNLLEFPPTTNYWVRHCLVDKKEKDNYIVCLFIVINDCPTIVSSDFDICDLTKALKNPKEKLEKVLRDEEITMQVLHPEKDCGTVDMQFENTQKKIFCDILEVIFLHIQNSNAVTILKIQ